MRWLQASHPLPAAPRSGPCFATHEKNPSLIRMFWSGVRELFHIREPHPYQPVPYGRHIDARCVKIKSSLSHELDPTRWNAVTFMVATCKASSKRDRAVTNVSASSIAKVLPFHRATNPSVSFISKRKVPPGFNAASTFSKIVVTSSNEFRWFKLSDSHTAKEKAASALNFKSSATWYAVAGIAPVLRQSSRGNHQRLEV